MLQNTQTALSRFNPDPAARTPEQRQPLLRRDAAAEYLLSRWGFGSKSWLDKAAVTGRGPKFFKFGSRVVLYDIADLDTWAAEALGAPRASTSDNAEK
jgi:predicted DNA-binding transcriptional regulator AlpA